MFLVRFRTEGHWSLLFLIPFRTCVAVLLVSGTISYRRSVFTVHATILYQSTCNWFACFHKDFVPKVTDFDCLPYDFVNVAVLLVAGTVSSYQRSLFFFCLVRFTNQCRSTCLFLARFHTNGPCFFICLRRCRSNVVLSACLLHDFVLFVNSGARSTRKRGKPKTFGTKRTASGCKRRHWCQYLLASIAEQYEIVQETAPQTKHWYETK